MTEKPHNGGVNLGSGRRAKTAVMGQSHTCALLADESVRCWGTGGILGLGDGQARGDEPNEMGDNLPPVDLGPGRTAKILAAGDAHTCALLDDSRVKCWGYGSNGQLGLGDHGLLSTGYGPGQMGDNLPAVNLGTGRATTIAEVARVISAGMGLDIEPEYRQQYRAGDIRHCFADPTEAERALGFKAKTSFEDGMAELIGWLEEQRANDHVDAATEELLARGLAR